MEQNHPKPFDLQDSVTAKIYKLSQRHASQAARVLRELSGPPLSEWRILMVLATYGPSTAAEISRYLQLDDSLVSRTIKVMLRKGFLQSAPDPKDRRASNLSLSKEGSTLYERMRPGMHRRRVAVHDALTTEEHNTLRALLAKLDRRMDEIDEYLQSDTE